MAFQRNKPAAIGVKAPFPAFIEPALASSTEKVPSGERWIHEIKFDGYRVQVHLANETAKISTRRGHDWTHRFKKVAHDAWRIKANSAVVDGEIEFTNLDWRVSEVELLAAFELEAVSLMNDFAAQAMAAPVLEADDLRHVGPEVHGDAAAPIAVLGPGIANVAVGIEKLVKKVLEMVK